MRGPLPGFPLWPLWTPCSEFSLAQPLTDLQPVPRPQQPSCGNMQSLEYPIPSSQTSFPSPPIIFLGILSPHLHHSISSQLEWEWLLLPLFNLLVSPKNPRWGSAGLSPSPCPTGRIHQSLLTPPESRICHTDNFNQIFQSFIKQRFSSQLENPQLRAVLIGISTDEG